MSTRSMADARPLDNPLLPAPTRGLTWYLSSGDHAHPQRGMGLHPLRFSLGDSVASAHVALRALLAIPSACGGGAGGIGLVITHLRSA